MRVIRIIKAQRIRRHVPVRHGEWEKRWARDRRTLRTPESDPAVSIKLCLLF